MARAVWKGPYVDESLIQKVEKQKNNINKTITIKIIKIFNFFSKKPYLRRLNILYIN